MEKKIYMDVKVPKIYKGNEKMENVLDKILCYIYNEKWVVVSAEEEMSEYELSDIRSHLEGEEVSVM